MAKVREPVHGAARAYAPYSPAQVEGKWYAFWEAHGYFKPREAASISPFTIIMPPPNVTGALHMGHALTASIEDALIRWHRMMGEPTLWLPGRDHAGIAGQWVVEKLLAQEGKTRHDLGREAFLERVWDWMHTYGQIIRDQHKRLGASADWDRECFTMDPGPSRAVRAAFVRLYQKGLIYRGKRITNWCPRCQTALSDLEVEHEEVPGQLAYVRYLLVDDGQQALTIATTRPETILADTAVAVNPEDPRYRHLIGRRAVVPVVRREVPIVADLAVDPNFGTGALKITPGHDPVDFEVGQRHNLDTLLVIALDGTMNEQAGPYRGLSALEARERLLDDLRAQGLLVKTEPYTHSVGHCQRCHTAVEPLVSDQWYVRIKPLAEPAIQAVRDKQIEIVPEHFAKVYFNWMENIRDWCISRQLWWGHRIPVWHCQDCGHQMAAVEDPSACGQCEGVNLRQDPDVLDTWFSSALWPFSILGWPDDTPDLRRYYPSSVMETGYDILFFWVARMVMMGLELTGDIPFRHVYLHGLIRVLDPEGRRVKMSKTAGNVQDPLDMIERYGADALRLALLTGASPGNDFTLSLDKIEAQRDFVNKLWNVGRFVLTNMRPETRLSGLGAAREALLRDGGSSPEVGLAERWILSRCNAVVAQTTRLLEQFQLGEAVRTLHDFVWGEFADWYLEIAKIQLREGQREEARTGVEVVLASVFETMLRLLHPFAPFVTEELWQQLHKPLAGLDAPETREQVEPAALIAALWPRHEPGLADPESEGRMAGVIELVRGLRKLRADYGVEPGRRVRATLVCGELVGLFERLRPVISALARMEPLTVQREADGRWGRSLSVVAGGVQAFVPVEGLFDLEQEMERLGKEAREAASAVERLEALLARPGFAAKAPPDVVARERQNLEEGRARYSALRERLRALEQMADPAE